jgi:hypothetical protein
MEFAHHDGNIASVYWRRQYRLLPPGIILELPPAAELPYGRLYKGTEKY